MITINALTTNKSWNKYIKNPDRYFNKKAKLLSKSINFLKKGKFNLSVVLAGNKEIRILNRKYRKKNLSTDVLSFPFQEKKKLKKLIRLKEDIYLGDIVVNFYKIKKNLNLNEFNLEFNKLWVHGLLHLLGHKHKKNKDYKLMLIQEQKISSLLN